MRNFLLGLLAAITLGSLPAYTCASPQDKPTEDSLTIDVKPVKQSAKVSDEVQIAANSLGTRYLVPMVTSMTRMSAYMAIEPQKACDAAKKINQLSIEGIAFYQSEKKRLSAKNKDTSELDSVGQNFDQMPEMSKKTMDAACSQEILTYIEATPNKIATSSVLLHLADAIDDMNMGFYSETLDGDTKSACQSFLKAETELAAAQKSLDAGKDVIDAAKKEDLEKQIANLHSQLQVKVASCKAA